MDKLSIYEYANRNIIDYTGQDSTANLLKEYAVYGVYSDRCVPLARCFRASLTEGENHLHGD